MKPSKKKRLAARAEAHRAGHAARREAAREATKDNGILGFKKAGTVSDLYDVAHKDNEGRKALQIQKRADAAQRDLDNTRYAVDNRLRARGFDVLVHDAGAYQRERAAMHKLRSERVYLNDDTSLRLGGGRRLEDPSLSTRPKTATHIVSPNA
jgi:hypothetical protein